MFVDITPTKRAPGGRHSRTEWAEASADENALAVISEVAQWVCRKSNPGHSSVHLLKNTATQRYLEISVCLLHQDSIRISKIKIIYRLHVVVTSNSASKKWHVRGSRVRETGVGWPQHHMQKQDVMLFQPFVNNIPSYHEKQPYPPDIR